MTRSILALFLLVSCVKPGPVQSQHARLLETIKQAETDEWTIKCAPEEMALAAAHREFAELEMNQGDLLRAEEHLTVALDKTAEANKLADECRPKDTDGDGLMDPDDACPEKPETKNGYKDEDGCPEKDTDGDAIFDELDNCPNEPEDKDLFEDEDGCPEEDNDRDGIIDSQDKCPNIPEDYDAFQDKDGCPEDSSDTDGDGIFDDIDKCVNRPENFNNYLDKDGCPDVAPKNIRITNDKIEIQQKILFQTGRAIILKESYGILNSVGQVLRDYSKIRVRVDGHTDSRGTDVYNLDLSNKRSKSVRDHLIQIEGIDPSRLEFQGFGESKPIDDNQIPSGREKNRRVEFTILEGMEP